MLYRQQKPVVVPLEGTRQRIGDKTMTNIKNGIPLWWLVMAAALTPKSAGT